MLFKMIKPITPAQLFYESLVLSVGCEILTVKGSDKSHIANSRRMVSSNDLWYLNENNLEQKSALWKYIFIYFSIYTQLRNVKKFLFMKELTIVQKV